MSLKKFRAKKKIDAENTISVEGSRELEPQVTPSDVVHVSKLPTLSTKSLAIAGVVIVVVLLLASLPAYYFYSQYQTAQRLKNPTAAAEEQLKSITAEVGRVMLLPTGESPTLATVSDKTKLGGQQFFANAENGDKVLIYTNAKKAILYRPSVKKIIEVGPINITGDAAAPNAQVAGASTATTPTPSTTPVSLPAKVALLNGTTVVGLTKKVETELAGTVPSIEVTVKDNAVKNDYAQTIVIPGTPAQASTAEQIAKALGGKVTSLPSGEVAPPDTNITVILGQNSSK